MNLGLSIPMFNEEGNAERVLARMLSHLEELNISFMLAVVNNGSTDGTGSVLDRMSARDDRIVPIHLQENQGYGGGILSGINTLLQRSPEVIGWSWGDGQVCSTVLSTLYKECQSGVDLAKTCRIQRQDGYRRRVISSIYAKGMRILGIRTPDINGCPKLFRSAFFTRLELESQDWFLDAEAILKTEKYEGLIHNEPVIMEPRSFGESKVRMSTLGEFTKNMIRWKFKRY
jgi:glycosyltransferase involved in cell wall biosynthesis